MIAHSPQIHRAIHVHEPECQAAAPLYGQTGGVPNHDSDMLSQPRQDRFQAAYLQTVIREEASQRCVCLPERPEGSGLVDCGIRGLHRQKRPE